MSDPSHPDSLHGSYEEGVKLMERVLDSKRTTGAVSRQDIPASAPISFGDSVLQSAPTTTSQPALRNSASGKKEGGKAKDSSSSGDTQAASSSTTPATSGSSAPSSSISAPTGAAAEGGAAKKSKNQLKKENRGQANDKFWEEVAAGLRPDPRAAKAERQKKEAEGGGDGGAKGKKGGAKAAGGPDGASGGAKAAGDNASGGAKGAGAAAGAVKATGGHGSGSSASGAKASGSSHGGSSSATASGPSSATGDSGVNAASKGRASMMTSYQFDDPKRKAHAKRKQIINREQTPKELDLFSHMPQPETYTGTVSDAILLNHPSIPTQFVTYGLQIASKKIQGSNARNLALVDAFMAYLETFAPHQSKPFHVDLDAKMKPIIQYVVDSRPLSIGQSNIIKFLKLKMSELGSDTSITTTEDARKYLIRQLKTLKEVHILNADQAIQEKVSSKIQDNDVVLTFGRSYIVSKSLQLAAASGKKFKVIVLDSKPRFEGKRTLQELSDLNIELEYAYINAISYFMKGVTKVLVGASSMMGNGQLFARAGTSIVCMMAHTYRVPVLVACETYKFSDKVQLDAITRNEVDDPDLLNRPNLEGHNSLKDWKSVAKLKMLNLVYDLTPSEFISMIITEHGPVPSTSVPALIREFHSAF